MHILYLLIDSDVKIALLSMVSHLFINYNLCRSVFVNFEGLEFSLRSKEVRDLLLSELTLTR